MTLWFHKYEFCCRYCKHFFVSCCCFYIKLLNWSHSILFEPQLCSIFLVMKPVSAHVVGVCDSPLRWRRLLLISVEYCARCEFRDVTYSRDGVLLRFSALSKVLPRILPVRLLCGLCNEIFYHTYIVFFSIPSVVLFGKWARHDVTW